MEMSYGGKHIKTHLGILYLPWGNFNIEHHVLKRVDDKIEKLVQHKDKEKNNKHE